MLKNDQTYLAICTANMVFIPQNFQSMFNHFQRYAWKGRGCARYIFASLFLKSEGEHLWN